jgi:hypothetical protein
MLYNKNMIVTITIRDKKLNYDYHYQRERCFLGIIIKREGFFARYFDEAPVYYGKSVSGFRKFINNKYIVQDKKVYFKPRVIIELVNEQTIKYEFDTYDKALDWVSEFVTVNNLSHDLIDV